MAKCCAYVVPHEAGHKYNSMTQLVFDSWQFEAFCSEV